MEPLGHDFLAGAVLAAHQHVGVGRGHPLHELEHRPHRRGLGDQLRGTVAAKQPVLALQPPGAAQRASQLDLGAQGGQEPVVVPRLLDEIARAAAHRLDRLLDAAPRGHHDRRQRGVEGLELRDQLQSLAAGGGVARVVEIEEHRVEVGGLHRREHAGGRGGGLDVVALALQQQPQRLADVRLVVRDEDVGGMGDGRSAQVVSM